MARPSTASTLSGRVAAGQGEGHQLGLVAELGEEHHHEGGAARHPSVRSAPRAGTRRLRATTSPHALASDSLVARRSSSRWPRAAARDGGDPTDHRGLQGRRRRAR